MSVSPAGQLPFRTLLYRYFFFGWLYKSVNRGDASERAAALRYNREHSHWLLTYMKRWLCFGALFWALGVLAQSVLHAPVLASLFYIPGAMSLPMDALIGLTWVALKVLPAVF